MSALARLLVRVSKRVLTHNPTNDELLQTADRVILWRNADYITDAQVEEIAAVMPEPEPEPSTEPQEAAQGVDNGETEEVSTPAESEGESEPESAEKPLEDMTKAELLEYASAHSVEAYESWTKAEIIAAIEGAE